MHKLIKNKILLFHIFLANSIPSFAEEAKTKEQIQSQSEEEKNDTSENKIVETSKQNSETTTQNTEKNSSDSANLGTFDFVNNALRGKNIFNSSDKAETSEISALNKENTLLELQMKNKILKLELAKKNKELKDFEKTNQEGEAEKILQKQIKKIQQRLDLIQAKKALFIAQQYDNEESRENLKRHLDMANREKELSLEIAMLNKERDLKNMKEEMLDANNIEYLDDPFLKNGTLVLSDRQIKIGLHINDEIAEKIEHDIDYFNNKNSKQPIFLIIDKCYGGYLDAGSRIISKIQNSTAPVYVVVKAFAASMAAIITTLAPRSFCFANTEMLHHQPSRSGLFYSMNVREHEEALKELESVWKRAMGPVAKKMGITLDALMKKMYEKNSHGDWKVFGDEAKKIKWVDNVITNIRDTSVNKKFKKDKTPQKNSIKDLVEEQNESLTPSLSYVYIPKSLVE